jgi:hypothetical protein
MTVSGSGSKDASRRGEIALVGGCRECLVTVSQQYRFLFPVTLL